MKLQKKQTLIFLILCFLICFIGCKTNNTKDSTEKKIETPILDNDSIIVSNEAQEEKILETEKTKDSPEKIEENASSETKTESQKIDEEYKRSTSELQDQIITQDDFLADKKDILKIIDELAKIMLAQDYGKWLYYLSPQSKEYWQNQSHLADVSSRLPVKGYTLKNLEDYFKMIFIPSRRNSSVDEIRYISPTFVKAVQVRGNQDIVYYFFIKINNTWLLELDTL